MQMRKLLRRKDSTYLPTKTQLLTLMPPELSHSRPLCIDCMLRFRDTVQFDGRGWMLRAARYLRGAAQASRESLRLLSADYQLMARYNYARMLRIFPISMSWMVTVQLCFGPLCAKCDTGLHQ